MKYTPPKPRRSRPGRYARVKTYGKLHHSGKNRAQRRAEAAGIRHTASRRLKKKAEDMHEANKAVIAARVARKQSAAHDRALKRKEERKGITPGVLTRAQRKLQDALRARREKKARRQAAYNRKHKI